MGRPSPFAWASQWHRWMLNVFQAACRACNQWLPSTDGAGLCRCAMLSSCSGAGMGWGLSTCSFQKKRRMCSGLMKVLLACVTFLFRLLVQGVFERANAQFLYLFFLPSAGHSGTQGSVLAVSTTVNVSKITSFGAKIDRVLAFCIMCLHV